MSAKISPVTFKNDNASKYKLLLKNAGTMLMD